MNYTIDNTEYEIVVTTLTEDEIDYHLVNSMTGEPMYNVNSLVFADQLAIEDKIMEAEAEARWRTS